MIKQLTELQLDICRSQILSQKRQTRWHIELTDNAIITPPKKEFVFDFPSLEAFESISGSYLHKDSRGVFPLKTEVEGKLPPHRTRRGQLTGRKEPLASPGEHYFSTRRTNGTELLEPKVKTIYFIIKISLFPLITYHLSWPLCLQTLVANLWPIYGRKYVHFILMSQCRLVYETRNACCELKSFKTKNICLVNQVLDININIIPTLLTGNRRRIH